MPDTTVYFATNRRPDTHVPGGFGADVVADPTQITYAVVPVTGTDLGDASSGQLGTITAVSDGGFASTVQAELENTGKNLLVFIHGFDNSFLDAIKRSAFNRAWFADSGIAGTDTTVVAFTWPSSGNLIGSLPHPPDAAYLQDMAMAWASGASIAAFLHNVLQLVVQTRDAGRRSFLLAHSMGNHALAAAIANGMVPGANQYDEAILAAGDEVFTTLETPGTGMYGLRDLAKRISVYSSRRDIAMDLARCINHNQRLGFDGPENKIDAQIYEPATFRSVDCTDVYDFPSFLPIDATHQYYRRSKTVRTDIGKLMANQPVEPGPSRLSHYLL
jgi:esterase/lipase superfamily enzyme